MSVVSKRNNCLFYKGSSNFRTRILLSVLSGKSVKITDIRTTDADPGLKEFEVNFIRLIDKITNGTVIEVNETGTSVYFQPGLLHGGEISHECCTLKNISYYLEILISLAPFCKKPFRCTLTGVTNSKDETSVDSIIHGLIPVLKRFLIVDDNLEVKIIKRGMAPKGGGEVLFTCPVRRDIKALQVSDMGKVKRIRGTVYAVRVSPETANRIVESAKGVLLKFLPDIYLYTDHYKGAKSGNSPGFGISLVAETTTGMFLTCDLNSNPAGAGYTPTIPEELGRSAAGLLLEEIYRGGCVTSSFQAYAAMWMSLTQRNVSKFLIGPISPFMISMLRQIKDFFGITFQLQPKTNEDYDDVDSGCTKILITCLGVGYTNINKRVL